ncbi:MAG: hypothetical protein AAF546_04860 [Verrucomicrobiota bacterium]
MLDRRRLYENPLRFGTVFLGTILVLVTQVRAEDSDLPQAILEETTLKGYDDKEFTLGETGKRSFSAEDIDGLGGATYDPNELLEILPNVQFSNRRYRLNPDSLESLEPEEISISGARPGENTFIIDGLATNNLLDSISQQAFDQVEASSQAVFLDTDLIETLTVIDSNVTAEYGGFLGGVVEAKLRAPKPDLSGSFNFDYASSDYVEYLLDEQSIQESVVETTREEPTEFTRTRYAASFDIPIRSWFRTLFSYSRAESEVIRSALSSSYFSGRRPRTTIRENILAKAQIDLGVNTVLDVSTLITPYENQYWRTNIGKQFGGGSTTTAKIESDFEDGKMVLQLGYTTVNNEREEDADHFIYANTPSIDWVPDTANSALAGGFGDLDSSQESLDLSFTHTWSLIDGKISIGSEANYITAERGRPVTTFGYRDALPIILPDGVNLVEENPVPGTLIPGEQVLLERNDYRAFRAEAEIFQISAFIDANKSYEIFDWLSVEPYAGFRFEYESFLENFNISPRANVTFKLPFDFSVNFGANRYYAKNQLIYALREQDPDNFVYTRSLTFEDPNIVVSDFALEKQTMVSSFSSSNLDTPYSDELTVSVTTEIWELGEFRVKGLMRFNRDGLARSEPIIEERLDELGNPFTTNRYELTNSGEGEYQSLSFEWSKRLLNSRFSISSTISENIISRSTDTLLTFNDDEDVRVFFKGELIDYSELNVEREDFNTPLYVAGSWTADWLDNKLKTALRFRYRPSYTAIVETSETISIPGEVGSPFDVYEEQDLDDQFVVDASIRYTFDLPRDLKLETKVFIDNLFNTVPNVPVTNTQPYQQGRSYSFAASLRF